MKWIAGAVLAGKNAAATLSSDGSWPDVNYADMSAANWKADAHLMRLEAMAKACAHKSGC